jgi:hypothetical protein
VTEAGSIRVASASRSADADPDYFIHLAARDLGMFSGKTHPDRAIALNGGPRVLAADPHLPNERASSLPALGVTRQVSGLLDTAEVGLIVVVRSPADGAVRRTGLKRGALGFLAA